MRLIRSIRFVCRLQSSRRYFFSIAQLNATSQLIFVSDREYVLAGAYYTMVVIQITAFMMTLRKKGFMYVLVQAGVRVEPCLYLGCDCHLRRNRRIYWNLADCMHNRLQSPPRPPLTYVSRTPRGGQSMSMPTNLLCKYQCSSGRYDNLYIYAPNPIALLLFYCCLLTHAFMH